MSSIMVGIIYAGLTGVLVATQSVMNTRVSDNIGMWETTVIVHFIGLVFGTILMLLVGKGDFLAIKNINKLYLLGGAIGVLVVFSTMMGMKNLGASYTVAIMVVSQLIVASIIDNYGLLASPIRPFTLNKLIGLIVMTVGIFIFQKK